MSLPVKVYKLGKVEISIWKSDKFENSFSFKFQKNYKTENGWKQSDFFTIEDLNNVRALCELIIQRKISEKTPEKKQENKQEEDYNF